MIPLLSALLFAGRAAAAAVELGPDDVVAAEIIGAELDPVTGPVPITGGWRLAGTADGVRTWQAPLPVRTRSLFFFKPPDDLAVLRRTKEKLPWSQARSLRHAPDLPGWSTKGTWAFTADSVVIRRPASEGPPQPWEYAIRYTRALEREAQLRVTAHNPAEAAAAFQSVQVDDSSREGVLIPAPGSLTFRVTVPDHGVLDFSSLLVPPEAADPVEGSDGASLSVTLIDEGVETALLTDRPRLRRARPLRADLSAWAGKTVELRFDTDPGEEADYDYVFLADPVVFTPSDKPRRMVLVFIDTLRPDHLSLYGYERDTTPNLNHWAEQAAVFEEARSVAPWTLPSSRTMLLGDDPEAWDRSPRLQRRLGEAGWATAYLAGNVYLSSNFGMGEGWSEHRCINWPQAWVQVDRAQAFLDAHADRDAFVVLHLMDMHLPYREPWPWSHQFSGERPAYFRDDSFHRADIAKVEGKLGEAGKQYIRDRYDNNVAYVDHALQPFLAGLPDDATVILLADHGEEFWDHGSFEHGHTLYEELLHIPLVARGPGITPGRVKGPVSLKDVAPTFAVAADLPTDGMTGIPLQTLSASPPPETRPLAFGRPLYGTRRWGVLADGRKYTNHEGNQSRFDLRADPGEQTDLFAKDPNNAADLAAMAQALGVPVYDALRILPAKGNGEVEIEVIFPGGVAQAVVGEDPLMSSEVKLEVCPDRIFATYKAGYPGTREVFVVPVGPLGEALSSAIVYLRAGKDETIAQAAFGLGGPPAPSAKGAPLFRGKAGKRAVAFTYGITPIPKAGGTDLQGMDPELEGALAALGYVAEDGEAVAAPAAAAAPTSSRCP